MSDEKPQQSEAAQQKSEAAEREERVLERWKEQGIFQKTLQKKSPQGEFIFYEGPPTANGRPGIHHLAARAFKDLIPRYKTMRGYHVRRKGGWDTHGLPVELEVEMELGLTSKRAIEEYGIAAFNKKCRESVWRYVDEWQRFTQRVAYWIDTDNPYVTYDPHYMESLWHIVSKAHERELLYKDYKVVPWCPRCGTALSSHELAQGYAEVKDLSVYVKFKVANPEEKGLPENTYLLAWTTTPWTLPGNVALAVGEELDYVLVAGEDDKEHYILAKELLQLTEVPSSEDSPRASRTNRRFKGKDLIGLSYEPLYPYLKDALPDDQRDKLKNAFKVYPADFVSTDEGTGIVHTAVMYGQDDFELGSNVGLPKHHLVHVDGSFKEEVEAFNGMKVYEEDTAVAIVKDLAHRNLLFKKEKYEHSYPFCWRCKTRLMYFARDSWYLAMSRLRDELKAANEAIHWEPSHIKHGRFGEWLSEVKDWAISRERYWGTTLPVWESEDGAERLVIGSLEELKARTKKSGNQYLIVRHGEARSNVEGFVNCLFDESNMLTERGRESVRAAAQALQQAGVTRIYHSPLPRTRDTAAIIAEELGLAPQKVHEDARLVENQFGALEGQSLEEYHAFYETLAQKMTKTPEGGENWHETKTRMTEALYDIEHKHQNEVIAVVSHNGPLQMLQAGARGMDDENAGQALEAERFLMDNGEVRELDFVPLPHNEDYELDLHRPYIDEIELVSESGTPLYRTKEVMDVWFDSGGMPFAQDHYPFENKEWIDEEGGFPADYICEAIDQTRGWFYTLHAEGVIMKDTAAYKNVICLGHILDAQGKKMSKSLGNIVDPWEMMETYGVDVLRFWMYSVNQPGEPKYFDEMTVEEVRRKVFNLLENVVTFYELYADEPGNTAPSRTSEHVLDRWIIARTDSVTRVVSDSLDHYKVLEAARAVREYVADLSQWYIRRSRDRFKGENAEDKAAALATTKHVLLTVSKLLAPFAPFTAEEVYTRVGGERESVHLEDWPEAPAVTVEDLELFDEMKSARALVSEVLEQRARNNIKVRQPLSELKTKRRFSDEIAKVIAHEVNVEAVTYTEDLSARYALITEITDELQRKGDVRELIRHIQVLRKRAGLQPQDRATLIVATDEAGRALITQFEEEITKTTGVDGIAFADNDGDPVQTETAAFTVSLEAHPRNDS